MVCREHGASLLLQAQQYWRRVAHEEGDRIGVNAFSSEVWNMLLLLDSEKGIKPRELKPAKK